MASNFDLTSQSGRYQGDLHTGRPQDAVYLLVICALCAVLFCWRLDARSLWDIDEGMHAATSKEMVLSGDWVTPRYNGEKFYDKPAFFNWLVALSFLILGFTEVAARLPGALLGWGTVLLTYALGRRLSHPRTGFLGALVLATSVEFIILSRSVVHDIALAFFVTLALYCFYGALEQARHRWRYLLMAYAAVGLAVLSKGPLGVVLPGLTLVVYLLLRGQWRQFRVLKPVWGMIIILAVAAPWYVMVALRNDDYTGYFFIQQNVLNFVSQAKARHPEPFYFYIPVIIGGMFPWSFFLPVAVVVMLRRWRSGLSGATLFLVVWLSAMVAFFSVAQSKLATYILPALPAAALLIGRLWHQRMLGHPDVNPRAFMVVLALMPVLLIAAVAVWFRVYPNLEPKQHFGISMQLMTMALSALALVFALAWWCGLFRRWRTAFGILAMTMVVGIHTFLSVFAPNIEPYRTTKKLALTLDRKLPPGQPIVFYRGVEDTAVFYTNRLGHSIALKENLLRFLGKNERVYCIVKTNDYEKVSGIDKKSYVHQQVGRQLLLSNRPPS
jgi:4-amino-4-deoxy-L-arabinose transferase-like glycosyltransferase